MSDERTDYESVRWGCYHTPEDQMKSDKEHDNALSDLYDGNRDLAVEREGQY
jgi:hypothetical protein